MAGPAPQACVLWSEDEAAGVAASPSTRRGPFDSVVCEASKAFKAGPDETRAARAHTAAFHKWVGWARTAAAAAADAAADAMEARVVLAPFTALEIGRSSCGAGTPPP